MIDEPRVIGPEDDQRDDAPEPLGDPPNGLVLRAVRALLFLYLLPLVAVAMLVAGAALVAWRSILAVEHLGRRVLGRAPAPAPPASAGAVTEPGVRPRAFPVAPHGPGARVLARRPSGRD